MLLCVVLGTVPLRIALMLAAAVRTRVRGPGWRRPLDLVLPLERHAVPKHVPVTALPSYRLGIEHLKLALTHTAQSVFEGTFRHEAEQKLLRLEADYCGPASCRSLSRVVRGSSEKVLKWEASHATSQWLYSVRLRCQEGLWHVVDVRIERVCFEGLS